MASTKVILLGAPGVGKGTQAKRLIDVLKVPHISTGDMLREARAAGTDLGKQAAGFMDQGQLVPDSLVIALVKDRVARSDCGKGYVLDGFPRTVAQAEAMDQAGIQVDAVADIAVAEGELVRRITGRRSCGSCGAVYHVEFSPPKDGAHCDKCGGALTIRDDDREETVRNRLRVYHEKTAPLAAFYGKKGLLRSVDGRGGPDEVFKKLIAALGA